MTVDRPAPPDTGQDWRRSVLWGVILGLLAAIPGLFLAVMSGGAGHGNYGIARALFPIPMLCTLLEDDTIGPFSTALAVIQLPLYGALWGWSKATARWLPLLVLIGLHAAAAIAAFSGTIPNFS